MAKDSLCAFDFCISEIKAHRLTPTLPYREIRATLVFKKEALASREGWVYGSASGVSEQEAPGPAAANFPADFVAPFPSQRLNRQGGSHATFFKPSRL